MCGAELPECLPDFRALGTAVFLAGTFVTTLGSIPGQAWLWPGPAEFRTS